MGQQVSVQRELVFSAVANDAANVGGNMLEMKTHFQDNFAGDTLSTFKWLATVPGTNDSIAIVEELGGMCTINTGDTDNDSCMLSSAIIWNGTQKAVFEATLTIDDVSSVYMFVGLSDAKLESNGQIAIEYPSGVLESNATDAVGFVVDADNDSSSIMCCGVAGATDETAVDSGTDWTDGAQHTLRIELSGQEAWFFLDGVAVGYGDTMVTADTLLCGTVQCGVREGTGAINIDVYQIDIWQDEVA